MLKVAAENFIRKPYINWAVKRVARSLQVLWPRSRTNIYGSNATGLSLPSSDVDLVVCLPPVRNLVRICPVLMKFSKRIILGNRLIFSKLSGTYQRSWYFRGTQWHQRNMPSGRQDYTIYCYLCFIFQTLLFNILVT